MCVLLPQMKLFSSSSLARSVHVALSVPGGAPAVETGWWPGELKPAKSDLLTLSKFLRDESLMRNLSASFPFQTKCDTVSITKTLGIIVLFLLNTWSNESWHHYSTFLFEPAGGALPALSSSHTFNPTFITGQIPVCVIPLCKCVELKSVTLQRSLWFTGTCASLCSSSVPQQSGYGPCRVQLMPSKLHKMIYYINWERSTVVHCLWIF